MLNFLGIHEFYHDENGLLDGRGRDLTLVVMIDRRVGLPLSPRSSLKGREFVAQDSSFSPLGEIREGFVTNPFLCAVSWCVPCGGLYRDLTSIESTNRRDEFFSVAMESLG